MNVETKEGDATIEASNITLEEARTMTEETKRHYERDIANPVILDIIANKADLEAGKLGRRYKVENKGAAQRLRASVDNYLQTHQPNLVVKLRGLTILVTKPLTIVDEELVKKYKERYEASLKVQKKWREKQAILAKEEITERHEGP